MDEYARNHLKAWVDNHAPIHYSDRETVFHTMCSIYDGNSDVADIAHNGKGWPSLFDYMMDSDEHRPVLRGYSRRYTKDDVRKSASETHLS